MQVFLNGAAWESNPPTDGLRRFSGFEALLRKVHLRTEAGFRPASVRLDAVRSRKTQYQFQYQVRPGLWLAVDRTARSSQASHRWEASAHMGQCW